MQYLLVAVMGALVVVADFYIKRSADSTPVFWQALCHRFMAAVLLLYGIQIALFVYLFQAKWDFSRLCVTQMAVYAVLSLGFGWCCGDRILPVNIIGVVVTLLGVALVNFNR